MGNAARDILLFSRSFDNWIDALEAFTLQKRAEGYSPRTIRDYRYHVSLLFQEHPEAWEPGHVKYAVLAYMAKDGIAAATFNIRRKYLRGFFSWALAEGLFPLNPMEGIKTRKAEPRVVQHDADLLTRLLGLPNRKTYCGARDYALICLSLDTAIRPSEALSLTLDDVDLHGLWVLVRASIAKTRKSRRLPFSPQTGEALQRLMATRHPEWRAGLLFLSQDGQQLTENAWAQRLRKVYAPKLGVKRLAPYDLRHDAALQALRNGMNPFALRALMGHSDLETTQHYVALVEADIQEAHKTASPVANLLPTSKRVRKIKVES